MISVDEALKRILAPVKALGTETVPITESLGRTLAEDITAERATPFADSSAMDGYAVRRADLDATPATLKLIGEAPAGAPYPGEVGACEAVRIFTGAVVPEGADTVIIQENTDSDGETVTVLHAADKGKNIRRAGQDFAAGQTLVRAGKPLNERDITLIAAGNAGKCKVYKRPKVAFLATGDELVAPGSPLNAGSVINSNIAMLSALIGTAGGTAVYPGILPDDLDAIKNALIQAKDADVIVTLGGASVGDYDFVLDALEAAGGSIDFWKIAMKPGKPLMFGELKGTPVIGLPGNPNSAYVGAFLFLLPALRKMQGQINPGPEAIPARLGSGLPETQDREQFILATMSFCTAAATLHATPLPIQDSAKITTLQAATALIRRSPLSPALDEGARVEVLPLPRP